MGPVFLAVVASILVYLVAVALIPRHVLQGSSRYTRHMLDKLHRQSLGQKGVNTEMQTGSAVQEDPVDNPLVRAFLLMPGMQRAVPLIQRAGIWRNLDQFVLVFLLIFLGLLVVSAPLGAMAVPLAVLGTWALAYLYLKRRISRRRQAFVEQFPDALDSMVRSVKAGHPLHVAIHAVAEHMAPPLGLEFRRVADEMAYGWTLFEALNRMADRIDEPDVRFFTVVLAVQQETGGNLSEVLTNLSSVIRKRRVLRMKVKALSSEGRMTTWILGSLPFFVFGILYWMAPAHLEPLWETSSGHIVLVAVLVLEVLGVTIVRQIVNMEL